MIEFNQLILKNFQSFGNKETVVDLSNGLFHLIIGENQDSGDSGISKNGVGKTTIFQALAWCLFDESISEIKQDDLINFLNKKDMVVKVTFKIDNDRYRVVRGRKPNIVEFTKNGSPVTNHSAAAVNESIRRVLGMNIDIFMNTVLLSSNNTSFMRLKPAPQRDFMENILNISLLTHRAEAVKAYNKDTAVEIRLEEQKKDTIDKTNQKTLQQIETLSQKEAVWESERTTGVDEYEAELAEYQTIDVDRELRLIAQERQLVEELQDISDEMSAIEKEFSAIDSDMKKKESELESLKQGVCPYCEQQYHNTDKIRHITEELERLERRMSEIEQRSLPLIEREEQANAKLEQFTKDHPEILSQSECQAIMQQIKSLSEKIDSLKSQSVNPYSDQIEVLRAGIEDYDTSTLYNLKKVDEHCKMLVKLLTNSKSFIRKSVIDQYVPYLNQRLSVYLADLQSPHKVKLNSDLTADVEYMGRDISYGNLSNGEKLRVDLALNLAFRDLVSVSGRKTNLLLCDEVFDNGSDGSFYNGVLKIFAKMKGTTVMVISHREDLSTHADVIVKVVKKGGFSKIFLSPAI